MEMKYVNVFFMGKVLMEKMMLIVLLVFLEVIIIFMIMFGFRNENENIVSAFEVEKLVEKSGDRNIYLRIMSYIWIDLMEKLILRKESMLMIE